MSGIKEGQRTRHAESHSHPLSYTRGRVAETCVKLILSIVLNMQFSYYILTSTIILLAMSIALIFVHSDEAAYVHNLACVLKLSIMR